ncbi:MAG: queuosine precursor transporter [Phascolarctobacterium sp.]|nr:queuosine precursor transporter [Phascolarctobacterium sp.]
MSNEILLILNLIFVYGSVILWYYFLKEKGLYCWTVLATVAANIEVMILVDAFGMQQTLGNILFASTFLVTDILSELYGKKQANTAVNIGIMTSVSFVVLSQFWLCYTPAAEDVVFPNIVAVFSNTPRIMIMGLLVYAVVQKIDVWLYHWWWSFTSKRFGSSRKYLWVRNNGSTMISQLLNTILFTLGAFYGVYDGSTLLDIVLFSYIIFFITSLLDTPFVYLARYLHK